MDSILLIDDDAELAELLRSYLTRDGFLAQSASDGETGLRLAQSGNFDLVVLDVMMPRMNGVEVLRRLRQEHKLPVLMLTARGDSIDRILGLEQGADDYVTKPCVPRELSARIRAILRRVREPKESSTDSLPLAVGAVTLYPARRLAERDGMPIELTSTEFSLLETLLRNAGRAVSKQELSERVLGRGLGPYDRSIDVHVSNLRQKVGNLPNGRPAIETVRGAGYQWVMQ